MTNGIGKPLFLALAVGTFALAACSHRDLTPTPMYATPSSGPSASPPASATGVAGTFPVTIVNDDPAIASSSINLYIYGQAVASPNAFEGVSANGATYSLASAGSVVSPIPWLGGSGNSETVFLPALIGARVYVVSGTLSSPIFQVAAAGGGPNAPAPWSNDTSQNVYFDNVEYAETTPADVNFDLSQTDALGLDMEVTATDSTGSQTIGFKSGALTAFAAALDLLGSPWSTLAAQMPYHIINPQHGSPNFFPSSTFLDSTIMTAWNAYTGGNWMEISAASLSATGYNGPLYGTVDSSGNFDFYATQSTSGALVGTIENPQTYAAAHPSTTGTVTNQTFAQNGVFDNFMTADASVPSLGPAVGNRLSGALNSGVMQATPPVTPALGTLLTAQPLCTNRFPSVAAAPYQNQFAGALHAIANNPTYSYDNGEAYGYPYDDLCGTSTDTTATGITQLTITINPS